LLGAVDWTVNHAYRIFHDLTLCNLKLNGVNNPTATTRKRDQDSMADLEPANVAKFNVSRASQYETESRIALAGYEACHELAACMLTASLGSGLPARVLVAGAGGPANEIVTLARLEPHWTFTAVDPSQPMLELCLSRIAAAGLGGRTEAILGFVDDVALDPPFEAATLIGVLHHLPGDDAKLEILKAIASRLKDGAPLILATNYRPYRSQPLLLRAWKERWRLLGATPEETQARFENIVNLADPPVSEYAVTDLLARAGYAPPLRFFASLFWGAWIARREV
jgi:tRNA (cmo5U34)-methyltransferase